MNTERSGFRWSDEEDQQLLEELENKIPIYNMAFNHKRSIIAIEKRIIYIIQKTHHNDGLASLKNDDSNTSSVVILNKIFNKLISLENKIISIENKLNKPNTHHLEEKNYEFI